MRRVFLAVVINHVSPSGVCRCSCARLDINVQTMKARKRLLELMSEGEEMTLNAAASKSHEVSGLWADKNGGLQD